MKHNLIALAVATALITPMAAHAAPKVYGKLNVSVENISDNLKEDDRWEAISNASRFGVKGEDEVTANVSAVYGIEWGVTTTGDDVSGLTATTTTATTTTGLDATGAAAKATSTSTSTVSGGNKLDLTQRNRYIGLKHQAAGTIKFGKVDSYLKTAQGEVDQFNDLNADLDKVIAGDNRINNVIAYESPKIASVLQFNLQLQPGEENVNKGTNTVNNPAADDNGLFDAISASVVLNSEEHGLYAALAIDQNIVSTFNAINSFAGKVETYKSIAGGTAAADKTDTIRLVGSYNLSDLGLTLGVLVQNAERSDEASVEYTAAPAGSVKQPIKGIVAEEKSFLVSAAYKLPVVEGLTLKAQYATATTSFAEGIKDVDLNQASLGVDYNLASKTKVYAYYSVRTIENGNNPKTLANGKTDSYDVSFFGLGVDHKF